MKSILNVASFNLAPEGTVERTAFEGLLHARRLGVQPRTSTGESAAIVNHNGIGAVQISFHQPQQNSLVITLPATYARSNGGLLGWQ